MSTGLIELRDDQLDEALEQVLLPGLVELIGRREPGHCLRIADLTSSLAARLCRRLRTASTTPHCYVLATDGAGVPRDVAASSSKLVELRNPDANGRQRPVLVAFIPPGTKASAEDSFGVATFEEVTLTDAYERLGDRLAQEVPAGLHAMIFGELFTALDEGAWPYAGALAKARYLLTCKHNDFDRQAAGAAVFELGLVPDFDLFRDFGQAAVRARANIEAMRTLTLTAASERQRVLALGLADAALQRRLSEFAAQVGLDDPRDWTRRIVIDAANWRLGFHEWVLAQPIVAADVHIEVLDVDLPVAQPGSGRDENSPLERLIGQQYLSVGLAGRDKLAVRFRVDPEPRRVPALAKFGVQIFSEEGGATGLVTTISAGQGSKSDFKALFSKLTKASWEEGWHFIRVTPLDLDGQAIRVPGRNTPSFAESDRFYVDTADEDAEVPEQSAGHATGLVQALREAQFAVLADGGDPTTVRLRGLTSRPAGRSRPRIVRASFTGNHLADILLPGPLQDIETSILSEPQAFQQWRMHLGLDGIGAPRRADILWPSNLDRHELAAFQAARAAVFTAVRDSAGQVAELVDLADFREEIRAYADSYKALLSRHLRRSQTAEGSEQAAALRALGDLMRIDTIGLDVSDYRGGRREALLIAPTHPLRLLWLLTWTELAATWLRWSSETSTEEILATRATLSESLSPRGFPYVVPHHDGRLLINADDLSPYWGVALPSETDEPRELLAELRGALKIAAADTTGTSLPRRLAERIDHYLRQHPYIDTLVVNVLGAVRAELLTDALRTITRRAEYAGLRFDVRLIVDDPETPETADGLAALAAATEPAAAASDGTSNQLRPRLAIAVQSIEEFRNHPEKWTAHLSILIDAFATEQIDAAPTSGHAADGTPPRRGIAPVHGLVQQTVTHYHEDAETIAWQRQPRFGASYPLPGAEDLSDLLAELPSIICAAACAVTTTDPQTTRLPTATLNLDAIDQVLLYQAHNISDWVITIDRTLGLEYFDQGGRAERTDYVIDHDTDHLAAGQRRMVVSSRSTDELRALLAPVVDQHGLHLDPRHTETFFDQMRFLSGRLAFKLASTARTQRTEVLGLGLARLYLDYQDALREQILVPLDAHQELYREPRARRGNRLITLDNQRTDLALFDINAQARRITCRLIEVKCYTTLGDISDYQRLKERIAGQLEASSDVIGHHFDPRRFDTDRPDRTVKNLQLASLLGHYLERAVRHQVMDHAAADEARWLLEHLDAGYRLEFTRTGLVFDLARPGTETETDGGIEFHRIGRDLIQELVDAVPTDHDLRQPAARERAEQAPPRSLASMDLTVPKVRDAAFHTPDRAHDTPEVELEVIDPLDVTGFVDRTIGEASPPIADHHGRPTSTTQTEQAGVNRSTAAVASQSDAPADPGAKRTDGGVARQPDVLLGATVPTAQFGLIGRAAGRTVALDLDETHTISLFGVQGGGKSYTLGSIIEMATLPIPGINQLPSPLATIVFHYSSTQDYAPEFTSMSSPNGDQRQLDVLLADYQAHPRAHNDIILLAPADHVDQRRTEYPGLTVHPLVFSSAELQAAHWRFLMGAVGNQSTYIRQLTRIMRSNRGNLTLAAIRTGIDASNMSDTLKQLAHQRLDLASDYIDDSAHLRDLVQPGRLIIVDLRDEFIEKDEALGLFVVLMQLFAEARNDGQRFNKLVVFDEAHKYIDSADLVEGLVETVREMRHKGMSVLVASQDPPSVPISLIELSNHIVMHKFTSPAWLKHLQRANAALTGLTAEKMANLGTGESFMWSSKATDASFTRAAIKITWRPRATRHGGETRTATGVRPPAE